MTGPVKKAGQSPEVIEVIEFLTIDTELSLAEREKKVRNYVHPLLNRERANPIE
ncbi:MAG: hypothetical protein ACFFD4_01570 [Candidatus Odinarchaeota archaeon]